MGATTRSPSIIPASNAVSCYKLEHIPQAKYRALLARIQRWLRPGGLLLVSMEVG